MASNNLKKDGFSFEEIESINRWRKDISEGRIYSHDEVMSYARKELFSNAKANV